MFRNWYHLLILIDCFAVIAIDASSLNDEGTKLDCFPPLGPVRGVERSRRRSAS